MKQHSDLPHATDIPARSGSSRPTLRLTPLLCLFLCLPILSGCVAAVAGAAAAGYYVGKDERSAGEIADDVTIGTALKTLYIRDPTIKALSIDIEVRNRVVALSGTVASEAARTRAIELARGVKGVTDVKSDLTISLPAVEDI